MSWAYTLTAQGMTHGFERGYYAFSGDPFGAEVVTGDLRETVGAASTEVPEANTSTLILLGFTPAPPDGSPGCAEHNRRPCSWTPPGQTGTPFPLLYFHTPPIFQYSSAGPCNPPGPAVMARSRSSSISCAE